MCGGFSCSKNALIALNLVYVVVAFLLIGVAAYGESASVVSSLSVVGGIVACGVLLLFIAVLGLVGATKHHQVILFFYMVVLFLLFLIQFSMACACLALRPEQQRTVLLDSWEIASDGIKTDAQETFTCCGFTNSSNIGLDKNMQHPACPKVCCDAGEDSNMCCMSLNSTESCKCSSCYNKLKDAVNSGLRVSGGIGLFFSFTEIIGFALAYRFRNQMNPSHGELLD